VRVLNVRKKLIRFGADPLAWLRRHKNRAIFFPRQFNIRQQALPRQGIYYIEFNRKSWGKRGNGLNLEASDDYRFFGSSFCGVLGLVRRSRYNDFPVACCCYGHSGDHPVAQGPAVGVAIRTAGSSWSTEKS
jgi:hypothetical protein